MVKRSRLLVRMLYENFLKYCQRTSTTELFSTTGFAIWICVENWSPLAFWFQLQQDLIELTNVPSRQKKIWKKKAVVAVTTVQTWALDLLLRNGSTVNVFTCAQRMLVRLKLPKLSDGIDLQANTSTFSVPSLSEKYNKSMGGVDLSDMLISLYRTQVKTKRWYIKVLFHCVDIAKVNSWLLYKCHCMQLETPKRKQKSLLEFILEISHSLLHRNTIPTAKIGRPSKRMPTDSNTQPEHKKRAASNSQPDFDIR